MPNNKDINLRSYLCVMPLIILTILHGGELKWELYIFYFLILALIFWIILKEFGSLFTTFEKDKNTYVLFTIYLLFLFLYILPVDSSLLYTLSPTVYEHYGFKKGDTTSQKFLTVSFYLTTGYLIKFIFATLLFFIVRHVYQTYQDILRVLRVWVIFVATLSIYSFLVLIHPSFELVEPLYPFNITTIDALNGTFSYKNHFSSFVASSIPLAIFFTYRSFNNRKETDNAYFEILTNSTILVILFISLIYTNSRGGILSIVLATLIIVFLTQAKFTITRKQLLLIFIFFIIISLAIYLSPLTERLSRELLSSNGRIQLLSTVIQIWRDNIFFGTGPGTYEVYQNIHKNPTLNNSPMWKKPHNDIIEIISTHGLIGTVLFILTIGKILLGNFVEIRKVGMLYLTILWALLIIIIHSSFDFIFYLPVIFFLFIFKVGLLFTIKSDIEKINKRM